MDQSAGQRTIKLWSCETAQNHSQSSLILQEFITWLHPNVPCQRLWRLLWSPPHCQYLSSSWPSWSGTRESLSFHFLERKKDRHWWGIPIQHINSMCVVSRLWSQTEFSPSASTSLIMSCSSASVGFWPRERMTVPSSLVVMVPSPSLSKSENASLNSGCRKKSGWAF